MAENDQYKVTYSLNGQPVEMPIANSKKEAINAFRALFPDWQMTSRHTMDFFVGGLTLTDLPADVYYIALDLVWDEERHGGPLAQYE
jgi:hypothetical protein